MTLNNPDLSRSSLQQNVPAMKHVILLTPLFLVLNATAQLGPEHRFVFPADAWAVVIGDMDTDGDGDAVQGNGDHIWVHEQFAVNQFRVTYDLGAPGRTDRLRMADLNGDGIDDLVMPRRDADAIACVQVLGGGSFGPLQDLVTGIDQVFDVQASDMDGDTDLDLVFAYDTTGVKIAWAVNQGGGAFVAGPVIASSATIEPYPEWWSYFDIDDVDNDGDADILVKGAALAWLNNDGLGNFVTTAIPGSTFFSDIQLADVDGDPYPDIIYTSGPEFYKRINNGSGGFNGAQLLASLNSFANPYHIEAVDINGDGDNDLIYRYGSGIAVTHLMQRADNNGSGAFALGSTSLGADDVQAFAVGDLDGTGDLDLFGRANRGLYVVPGTGINQLRLTSVPVPQHITVADTDGDGDTDVVLAGPAMWSPLSEGLPPLQLAVNTNSGGGTMNEAPEEVWLSPSPILRADNADLDGDGDQDLVALWQEPQAGTTKQYMVLENQGGVFDSIGAIGSQWFPYVSYDPFQPVLRDLDGDGDIDLMRHVASGLFRNPNNGSAVFGPEQEFDPGGMWIPSAATLCDVGGSPLPDYVWGHGNFGGNGPDSLFWNENMGLGVPGSNQFVAISPVLTYANVPIHSPVLSGTDLNSDGLEDLVVFNGDSIAVMYNSGGVFGAVQTWPCSAIAYAVGDMDGNGFVDIVTLSPNTDITAYLNNGVLFGVGQLMAAAPQSTGTSHLALADMDGDLDLDVITCSVLGSAAWLGNTGNFPLGLPEVRALAMVHVFPNPSSGDFTVRVPGPIQNAQLVDVRGRVLRIIIGNGTDQLRIDGDDLSQGLYVVRVVQDNGAVVAGRVVVE